jgi:putative Holliday junction resolvase
MTQGRVMALDVGDRTVGVALSDEMRMTSQPHGTIRYKGEHEHKKVIADLLKIVQEQTVTTIVAGFPLNMNGSEGPQAVKVKAFCERLAGAVEKVSPDMELVFWDERLSTQAADRHLIEADVSRQKRREIIDTMAAVFILQGYLGSI